MRPRLRSAGRQFSEFFKLFLHRVTNLWLLIFVSTTFRIYIMQDMLTRLSLKYQIGFVGAVGVLGLIVFAAAYFVSNTIQSRHQASVDEAAAMRFALDEVEINLLQARRTEKDFCFAATSDTWPDTRRWSAKFAKAS